MFSFGSPPPAAPGASTGGFGTQTPAPTPAGAFTFGSSQPAAAPTPAGAFTFGSSQPAAAPTTFGAQPAPTAAFGAAPAPFGSPAPAFGSSAPAPAFGAPAPSGGLFGSAPSGGGIFGSPSPAPSAFGAAPSAGLFGSVGNPAPGNQFAGQGAAPNPNPSIAGSMRYQDLPPQYQQAIDRLHEAVMLHKRTIHGLGNAGPRIPQVDPLSQLASRHLDPSSLQEAIQLAAAKAEKEAVRSVLFTKWPLETLKSQRGEEKKNEDTVGSSLLRAALQRCLDTQVDSIAQMPLPVLWELIREGEERLREAEVAIYELQLKQEQSSSLIEGRTSLESVIQDHHWKINELKQHRVPRLRDAVERLKLHYKVFEKDADVLVKAEIERRSEHQRLRAQLQKGSLQATVTGQTPGASTAPAPTAFGSATTAPAPLFGTTPAPATGGLFGTPAPAPGVFGGTQAPLFGATPATTAPGAPTAFGVAPSAPFGGTPAPAFGATPAATAPAAPAAFGGTPAPIFGAAPATTAPGAPAAFGAAPAPAFGAAPAPAFGAAPAPAFGGTPAATAAPTFGGFSSKPKGSGRRGKK